MLSLPPSRADMAILNPLPSAPSRFCAGMRTSSRITWRVAWAFQPIFFSTGPKEKPGVPFSTTKAEMPRGSGGSGTRHDDVDVGVSGPGDELLHAIQHDSHHRRGQHGWLKRRHRIRRPVQRGNMRPGFQKHTSGAANGSAARWLP